MSARGLSAVDTNSDKSAVLHARSVSSKPGPFVMVCAGDVCIFVSGRKPLPTYFIFSAVPYSSLMLELE